MARLTEALEIARDLDHPYSMAFALYHNGLLALFRSRFDECAQKAHELAVVAEDNDYVVWRTLANVLEGVSLTAVGRADEGLAMTETAIDLYQGLTTPPVFWPQLLAVRSLTHALAGRPEQALILINEAIQIGAPYATAPPDFLAFKGDFLRMLSPPDLSQAEAAYEEGIQAARAAGLHLIELQGLTRLVGLRRELGRFPDGSAKLAELYASFTEGHDEHDLTLARDLLKVEGSQSARRAGSELPD